MDVVNATPRHHGRINDENLTASQSVKSIKGSATGPRRFAMRTPSQQNLKTSFSNQMKQLTKEGSISEAAETELKKKESKLKSESVKSKHGHLEKEYMNSYNYIEGYYEDSEDVLKDLEMFDVPITTRVSVSDKLPYFDAPNKIGHEFDSSIFIAEEVSDDFSPCSLSDIEDF